MSTVTISIELPEELARKARDAGILENEIVARLIEAEINRVEVDTDEDAWDRAVVADALGLALNTDGSIDFDKLRAGGTTMTLDELKSELRDES